MPHEILVNPPPTLLDWVVRLIAVVLTIASAVWSSRQIIRGLPKFRAKIKDAAREDGDDATRILLVLLVSTAFAAALFALLIPPLLTFAFALHTCNPRILRAEFGGDAVTLRYEWPGSPAVLRYADVTDVGLYETRRRLRRTLHVRVSTPHGNVQVRSRWNDVADRFYHTLKVQTDGAASHR